MAATEYMRQCEVVKKHGDALLRQVAWLPEAYAKIGACIEILGEPGWTVTSVSYARHSREAVAEMQREYLRQRKASDI